MLSDVIIVCIAGGSGSGKTTLAKQIALNYDSSLISLIQLDSYYKDYSYLKADKRADLNFDHPDSIDFELLINHIIDIKSGTFIKVPIYDYVNHVRTSEHSFIEPTKVILVEGIFALFSEYIRKLAKIKIFIDTEPEVRLIRRMHRDLLERGRTLDSVSQQYLNTVKPMHQKFVEPTKQYADIIVSGEGSTAAAMGLILPRIDNYLSSSGT